MSMTFKIKTLTVNLDFTDIIHEINNSNNNSNNNNCPLCISYITSRNPHFFIYEMVLFRVKMMRQMVE